MKLIPKILLLSLIILNACVPARKLDELQGKYDNLSTEKQRQEELLKNCQTSIDVINKENKNLKTHVNQLKEDSIECYNSLERTKKLYEQSESTSQKIIDNNRYENEKLSAELNRKIEDLKLKELEINTKESRLIESQNKNRELANNLANTEADLKKREQRVAELEAILRAKDSAVKALKDKVTKALLGFQNQGLTIETRNGKVYVSMEEKLLFKSGSITVDPRGEQAILELAKALNQNPDVSILVEGHTDNVPMKAVGQIKDNLDLSVMRATSIARILTAKGSVDPKRVTSAGRGEHFPIADNTSIDGRAKNRRTEIILTPKLDELLSILGN